MSNYKWLLDAGHGGMTKDGKYTTAPAKMHVFEDGLIFCEGINNRAIVSKLVPMLEHAGIDYATVYDEVIDTPLSKRVERANKLHAQGNRCIYVSIHSDAMPEYAHGKGSGVSIYTSKGETESDRIARVFNETYSEFMSDFKIRKDYADGDADFEENFYVLRKTNCPAILIENLFFDNRREAEFLLSERGRDRIASVLLAGMLRVEGILSDD